MAERTSRFGDLLLRLALRGEHRVAMLSAGGQPQPGSVFRCETIMSTTKKSEIYRQGERLIGRFKDGDLSRREFLGRVGALAASCGVISGGAALAGVPGRAFAASAEPDSVRFDSWGGVAQKADEMLVMKPFSAKSGVSVREGSYGSMEEFLAKVQTSRPGDYNYFSLTNQMDYLRFCQLGYNVALDEKKIPRLSTISPDIVAAYKSASGGALCAVPTFLTVITIAYNNTRVTQGDVEREGANILLDSALKGHIAGEDNWFRRIWYGALQTGQNPNRITDIDAVWEKIRESRSVVFKYYQSGAEQMNLLGTGSAWLADAWGIRVYALKKQGRPISSFMPKGIAMSVGGLMPLKGSPIEPYYQIADLMLSPEVQFAKAVQYGFPPVIDPHLLQKTPELLQLPGFDPGGAHAGVIFPDARYWSENATAWQAQYRRVFIEA